MATVIPLAITLLFGVTAEARDVVPTNQGNHLQPIGKFPHDQHGYIVAVLPDGKVLAHGYDDRGMHDDGRERRSVLRDSLARQRAASSSRNDYLWNPARSAWRKIERPPECGHRRYLHTLTPLPGGKVLVAGGLCDVPRMREAEGQPYAPHTRLSLWSGASNAWEAAPTLTTARIFHTATLRPDGSVMIVGGARDPLLSDADGEPVLASVELYRDGQVEPLPELRMARARHATVALPDGAVLVTGGSGGEGKASAAVELWDPVQKSWRAIPPMHQARFDHSATLLDDGRVMVAGGVGKDDMPLASTEIWDPQREAWASGDPLLRPVQEHTVTRLANGNLLLLGGLSMRNEPVREAMLWDKNTARWLPAGWRLPGDSLRQRPPLATLLPRPDGSALAFAHGAIYRWIPGKAATQPFPYYLPRTAYTATATADGHILISGGRSDGMLVDWAELFDPETQRFTLAGRLTQPRTAHAALALPDGSVVVAGGWATHPASPREWVENHPEIWEPTSGTWRAIEEIRFTAQERAHMGLQQDGSVLFVASREAGHDEADIPSAYRAWRWDSASGRVESLRVPLEPRAHAGIAILADGRVLFAGGEKVEFVPEYHCPPVARTTRPTNDEEGDGCRDEPSRWQGYATHGVELWDSRRGTVSKQETLPERWAARHPITRVLRNGNVILTEYLPPSIHSGSQPVRVMLWNGQSGQWQELPKLDGNETPALTELADGTLATPSRRLSPGTTVWRETPSIQNLDAQVVELPSRRLLSFSSDAPHLAIHDTASEQWHLPASSHAPPRWVAPPTLLPLADGRLMAIGQIGTQKGNTSFIWNPVDLRWSIAGQLPTRSGQPSQAVELPSGRVVHLGAYRGGWLVCETWSPGEPTWQSCENFTITKKPESENNSLSGHDVALEVLDDGRAIVLNGSEAFIFDEAAKHWMKTRAEWSKAPIAFGAPIRPTEPYVRILDPATQDWLDATAAGTLYQERNYRFSPPTMLWNKNLRQWDYIFQSGASKMGTGAMRLPDGCAISWRKSPWTLFNPATGQVLQLHDPGIVVKADDFSMTVLTDGTVVFVNAGYRTPGALLFQTRRLGCGGFLVQPDDTAAMPPLLYEDSTTQRTGTPPPTTPPWWHATGHQAWEYRWSALAILGLLLFYAYARRRWPAVARILIFGAVLVAVIHLIGNIRFSMRVPAIDEGCDMVAEACLDPQTGILKPVPTLASESEEAVRTRIPCRYVGTWSSIRPKKVYRIILDESGRYEMSENRTGAGSTKTYRGYWAVQGNNMIWRGETKAVSMRIDVNPIVTESETGFELVEKDGSRTRFELIAPGEAQNCSP